METKMKQYEKDFKRFANIISKLKNNNNGCEWADTLIPLVIDIIPTEYRSDWEVFWSTAIPDKFWDNDSFVSDFDFQAEMYHNIDVPF